MNNRLPERIMYALGCTLVLSLHSLTPRNAFAQPTPSARDATVPTAATGAPSTRAASVSAAHASTNVASVDSVSAPQAPPSVAGSSTPNERAAASATEDKTPSVRDGASKTGVVNLNTATSAELERLPRIGPARAQAILALRTKLTRFSKVEQLLRVKGIGRATFRNLRPMLTLDGPTTLPERRSR